MNKIAVLGAGGFGREVLMLINQINSFDKKWEFIGFFDDGLERDTIVDKFKVLGGVKELNQFQQPINLVLAIGDPKTKKDLLNRIKNSHIKFPTLIHPGIAVSDSECSIGEGSIICAGTIITVNVKIGAHVIVNLSCTIGHDTLIGDFCSLMPGVNISGEVNVKQSAYIGTGVKIINRCTIGEGVVLGAGAVVTNNIPSNCTAVGVPAKPIKFS
jgi:sugar O-acyltransferase (sialic acid O-acetyltransferase NeuD family)